MKIKRSALIGILVVSLVALVAVGTWAWFTAQADPVVNTFTAGTVKIVLHDDFDTDGLAGNWNPGQCIDKVVYVENTGTKCAYVRVKLTPAWEGVVEDEGGSVIELDVDNISYGYSVENGTNAGINPDWIRSADGWYYYKTSLPGATGSTIAETTHLIDVVCLAGEGTGNDYQGATLTINVEAEAVQCSHDAYKDVWSSAGLDDDNGVLKLAATE